MKKTPRDQADVQNLLYACIDQEQSHLDQHVILRSEPHKWHVHTCIILPAIQRRGYHQQSVQVISSHQAEFHDCADTVAVVSLNLLVAGLQWLCGSVIE